MGSSTAGMDGLRVAEVLDADPRPTFVIDLDPDEDISARHPHGVKCLLPVFSNSALRIHERLCDALIGTDAQGLDTDDVKPGQSFTDFKKWVTGVTPHDESGDIFPLSFLYADMLWTGSTVQKRWRLISGNRLWRDTGPLRDLSSGSPPDIATGGLRAEQAPKQRRDRVTSTAAGTTIAAESTRHLAKTGSSDGTGASSLSNSIILSSPERAVTDWTVTKPKGVLSAHLQYARSINWAATPLGPMEKWSPEFRQAANLCMANPHPAALFWGSELTMLYNEAYAAEVAGNKHPSLMGTGFSGPFAELWDYTGPVFAECARTGISVRKEDDYLPINRYGLLEETFFSWSFTPLYGGTGKIQGFYNAPFDTTKQVLSHRRMQTIHKIGECTAHATTVKQFWKLVLEGLLDNERDVPFVLLYSVGDGDDGDHSSMSSGSTISLKTCHLEGSIGVPDGHIAAPQNLDLKRSREGFIPSFREAMRTREPTLLHTRDGSLPEALLDGIDWRGFGDPCREAIIFPVRPTNGESVLAFLVLGVNPRRPYDGHYMAFTSLINRQLATSLASVILFEDETRRNRDAVEAAVLEKQQLTQQLDLQASRLRRMTELSPLGMFLISPEGVLREANDRFYEMTGHGRENSEWEMGWMDFLTTESARIMQQGWQQLVEEHQPWSGELQLKRNAPNPVDPEGGSVECWVLLAASPELASDGKLRALMGSITEISHLKWAQGLQNRRLQEAVETRVRLESFIDITSHEMRNPLSAILQCADDISSTLMACREQGTPLGLPLVESCLDAAQTITLCVQHQKSIVDDILTISKLDSNLLLITPVASQPDEILRRAVGMFDPELRAKDIKVSFDIDASYSDLSISWVTIDPSRVLQILINLLTNAIKFTAPASSRLITVTLAASPQPPDGASRPGFQYVPSSTESSAVTGSDEWGKGELLYLRFDVRDSGCGLTPSEKQILFQRFKQASPRTHAQYGGSGLGLFISKRLAELHGGQIGVASEAGQGSVFGFFIQARRCEAPRLDDPARDAPLPIETHLGGSASLHNRPTPQRQDYASSASVATANLITSNSTPSDVIANPSNAVLLKPSDVSILVVEDNLINQKVLVKQLRKHGCSVSVANDGIECLAFLETTHFLAPDGADLSVILMDLEMPNMDGLTCVKEIRKMEGEGRMLNGKRVPVIAVTANVRDEQVTTARRCGMDDVVSKPFMIPELWKKIEGLMLQGGNGPEEGG